MIKTVLHKKTKHLFFKRLKASSLVEVLVAIVVCMIVFTLTMSILLKVDTESNPIMKLKADYIFSKNKELLLENIAQISETDTLIINDIRICRFAEPVDSLPNVLSVTFRVFDKNNTPMSIHKVLISNYQSETNE